MPQSKRPKDTSGQKMLYVGLGILVLIGVIGSLTKAPPAAPPEDNPRQSKETLVSHVENFVNFFTKIVPNQNRTRIVVPYAFESGPMPLYVAYETESGDLKEFLIFHPDLENLNWSKLQANGLTLYQKNAAYDSLTAFLENPPDTAVIFADLNLTTQYSQLDAEPIGDTLDLETTDYILTTYVPSVTENDVSYYENIFDTGDAKLDSQDQISWLIRAPLADEEHPYLLGEIHVTYLQKPQ